MAFCLAGCGGDKYSGTWIQTLDSVGEGSSLKQLVIEKNGANYICTEKIYNYVPDPNDVLVNNDELKSFLEQQYIRKVKRNPENGQEVVVDERQWNTENAPVNFSIKYEKTYRWKLQSSRATPLILRDGILTASGLLPVYLFKDDTIIQYETQQEFVESYPDFEKQAKEKIQANMRVFQKPQELGNKEEWTLNETTYQFFGYKKDYWREKKVVVHPVHFTKEIQYKFEDTTETETETKTESKAFDLTFKVFLLKYGSTILGAIVAVLAILFVARKFKEYRANKAQNFGQEYNPQYSTQLRSTQNGDKKGVKYCVECGAEIPGDAAFCPECGADQ